MYFPKYPMKSGVEDPNIETYADLDRACDRFLREHCIKFQKASAASIARHIRRKKPCDDEVIGGNESCQP